MLEIINKCTSLIFEIQIVILIFENYSHFLRKEKDFAGHESLLQCKIGITKNSECPENIAAHFRPIQYT